MMVTAASSPEIHNSGVLTKLGLIFMSSLCWLQPTNADEPAKQQSYKDPGTSITFYVESDGRHLAAMDSQRKLLWVRNPWEDAHAFCPYRTPRPVVASLKAAELTELGWSNLKSIGGNAEHRFIAIKFDSSQFGVLDESTGDFFPGGQN